MKIILLESTDSTNDYVKQLVPLRKNVIVCAGRQTSGRGTKGRAFLSEEGGVYLSALTFYEDLPASRAFEIMTHAAVAVCRMAERLGVQAEIKWPNDVLVHGKKLCGILIENGLANGFVDHSIVGIGVNASNDVSALGGIATTLSAEAGRSISADIAREKLIESYCKPSAFAEYLQCVKFLGQRIHVTEGDREYEAVARSILPDGRLEIEEGGEVRALSSAEIRISLQGGRP